MIAPSPADATLAVVVPTYRRPDSLLLTLDSVRAQEAEPFVIVVADNDAADTAGLDAARSWARRLGIEASVLLVPVAERGISANRNAGLAAAFAASPAIRAVAMIDDDAVAEPGWLAALARTQAAFDADIVCGPSIYELPAGTPDWARTAGPFRTTVRPTGRVIDNRSMCNALLTRRLRDGLGEVFDPAFGLSGGEDIEMFARAVSCGRIMAWCQEAVVREPVEPGRVSRRWLLARSYSAGHIQARLAIKQRGRAGAIRPQAAIAARALAGGLARRLFGASATVRFDGQSRIRNGLGRLAGLLQPPSIQY